MSQTVNQQKIAQVYHLPFVSSFGGSAMNLLSPQAGEHILDIGCGTGEFISQLHKLHVLATGIDCSENMIEQARHQYPTLSFEQLNALNLPYYEQFDAVFSNATLHDIRPPHLVIKNIYNALKPNGRFVAEFWGKGNMDEIFTEIIRQFKTFDIPYNDGDFPWYFPSVAEYSSLLESQNFQVTTAIHYSRPFLLKGENGLRNWLETNAALLFAHVTTETKNVLITRLENRMQDKLFQNGSWLAEAKHIRVHAVKRD
ncbi:class I SAM-dependent methyltransferase [Priestia megaterium]|uniref:class I SAM-dependent methyltransferase n=1 Tax=Priestia megaterium TaxID=1404 RepID=UPI003F809B33